MNSIYQILGAALDELEFRLLDAGFWSGQTPSQAALASTAPFACDTLEFAQWLQFIFIPRLRTLVETESPLPEKCAVAPMGEDYFRLLGKARGNAIASGAVVQVLRQLDILVSGQGQ